MQNNLPVNPTRLLHTWHRFFGFSALASFLVCSARLAIDDCCSNAVSVPEFSAVLALLSTSVDLSSEVEAAGGIDTPPSPFVLVSSTMNHF
jgi:hypothetical protein